jgi:glutathione S-transferase
MSGWSSTSSLARRGPRSIWLATPTVASRCSSSRTAAISPAESNAILWFLAEGTPLLPNDRLARARVLQWMFFEQYSHEPYVAVLRFWAHAGWLEEKRAQVPEKRERGEQALAVMDAHLDRRRFFVDERYSIADIALYAYTHVAEEGGFDLSRYAAVRAWLGRIAAEPRHVRITEV